MLNESYAMIKILEFHNSEEEEAKEATFFVSGRFLFNHA